MKPALALLAIAGLSACASQTIRDAHRMERCPVCREEFVSLPPSYCGGLREVHGLAPIYVSEPREQPEWVPHETFPRPVWLLTCPHCLYSAADSGFSDIDDDERSRLVKALANLSLVSPGNEARVEIARVCQKERRFSRARRIDLELFVYFSLSRDATVEDRERLLAALVRTLAPDDVPPHDRARFAYLAGEISHQLGRADEAKRFFEEAARVAGPLGIIPRTQGASIDDVRWVPGWAEAQLRRIELESIETGALSARAREARPADPPRPPWDVSDPPTEPQIAVQVLAGRVDPDAWRVLEEYVGRDPERLFDLERITPLDPERMRLAPDLYAFASGLDPKKPRGLKMLIFGEEGRIRGVDPNAIATLEASLSGRPFSAAAGKSLLDSLPLLLEEGNERAVLCFMRLAPHFDATDSYKAKRCIEAIARTPSVWPLVERLLPPLAGETGTVPLLLASAIRAKTEGVTEDLVRRLDDHPKERDLILGILGTLGDRAAVDYAVRMCEDENRNASRSCRDYLSRVGRPEEVRRLGKRALSEEYADHRWDLEECVRDIRIRLATTQPLRGLLTSAP